MAVDVTMPRLSDSMEEGTVLRWLKAAGDPVAVGDELAEIETDKANMTFEAEADGVLLEILVSEGESAPLGAPLARIGAPGESVAAPTEPAASAAPAGPATSTTHADRAGGGEDARPAAEGRTGAHPEPTGPARHAAELDPKAAQAANGRPAASPVARRLAAQHGIELATLTGTGPRGRIVKRDVEAAVVAAPASRVDPAAPADGATAAPPASSSAGAGGRGAATVQQLSRLQQVVARRMAESKATIPDFALWADVDMSACVELRNQLKALAEKPPSFNDMVVKAAALALREHPLANASWKDGAIELHERVNVGVAVAADDALVVPTITDADTRSLGEIARETRRLATAVRDGSVTPPELSGGTFTVSNLGMYGVRAFAAIVNPPQAAILSVGELAKRAVVAEDGSIVAREQLTLGLISDHRVLYGADAARFLARIRELLEQPLAMAL